MNKIFIIRALIFLVAGLIVMFFPTHVYKFQTYILDKLHIKHNLKKEKKYYYTGIILIIIAIGLLVYLSSSIFQ